ncbi:MAG: glutamate-5-semialdehyde dehydrogenase [Bacteroidales bacterium]|nr:glutamate-5-semialdehyde dehydrogenase [Bacteroidales bacterium]
MTDYNQCFEAARSAYRELSFVSAGTIDGVLRALVQALDSQVDEILDANKCDLLRMDASNPKYDRLKLSPERIHGIAEGVRQVAELPSPIGRILRQERRPNGLNIVRRSVPFGVVGIVYEARPNVTPDVFSLCFKAGNACVLKGGSDAEASNGKLVEIICRVLLEHGISSDTVCLLPSGRDSTAALLHANGLVDLVIPRGGRSLIDFVRREATVPVIETGAGVCHAYFDEAGDLNKGIAIVTNAKTRRVSVCNALDCLLVHRHRIDGLSELCGNLAEANVVLLADDTSFHTLQDRYPVSLLRHAEENDFGTEFLDYKMAVRVVDSVSEAVGHIARYGSGHSECIITENDKTADYFLTAVDAACVYHNAPTSFTDGGEFGLGAEIGISTQKLHARGPMGLEALNTYKWIIKGNGQTR